LRLLLINYEYPPIGAGAATATAAMARSAVAMGHEVTVLTAGFGAQVGWDRDGGLAVLRLAARRARADRSSIREMASYVLRAALALPGVVRRARPEGCIVFFALPCGPLGRLFRLLSGKPYVVSLRGGDVPGTERSLEAMHRRLRPVRRKVLRDAVAVVANSAGLAELSQRADPVPVRVIANGVDLLQFSPPARPPEEPLRFLFVGRLNEQKNVTVLLKAVAALAAGAPRPFRVSIVGDGPLAGALHDEAAALSLEPLIDWRPWLPREEMPALYRSAHCLVNPSLYEGMPNVVVEAMACALPVILSDVAGNRDVVADGDTGRLTPVSDVPALAAAMRSVIDDPGAARSLGARARAEVERRYSWEATTRAYVELFSR
jgi:glycosyltransferase involved in cell wall biosynthesis